MHLTPLEQSGLIITTNSGVKLAIDIGSYTPMDKLDNLTVDAMLVSHLHGDHFSTQHINKLTPAKLYLNEECLALLGSNAPNNMSRSEIIIVAVGDQIEIEGGISVEFFNVNHGPNVKVTPKENFGFLIKVDEGAEPAVGASGSVAGPQKIYFAGDMFSPSGIDVSNLEVDVALIPVGGFYTFGPAEAIAFAKQFKRIGRVIPMHYEKTPGMKEEFLKLAKTTNIQTL